MLVFCKCERASLSPINNSFYFADETHANGFDQKIIIVAHHDVILNWGSAKTLEELHCVWPFPIAKISYSYSWWLSRVFISHAPKKRFYLQAADLSASYVGENFNFNTMHDEVSLTGYRQESDFKKCI